MSVLLDMIPATMEVYATTRLVPLVALAILDLFHLIAKTEMNVLVLIYAETEHVLIHQGHSTAPVSVDTVERDVKMTWMNVVIPTFVHIMENASIMSVLTLVTAAVLDIRVINAVLISMNVLLIPAIMEFVITHLDLTHVRV